jgi:ABC-2 type transport system permease protein
MRTLFVQTLRELRSIFYTPVAYVVMFLFVALMGYNFYFAVTRLNKVAVDYTVNELTFLNALFIFIFAITTALITMRSFSEEYRMGTIEMLTTAPIKDWQVVLAKFFAAVLFYVILFAPTVVFYWIFVLVSGGILPAKSIGAIWSTYLILILIGMFFVSIGLFASSLVRDQVNAAVISIVVNILYIFVPLMLTSLFSVTNPTFRKASEFVSPMEHLSDFAKGLVDTRRLVWYLTMSIFFVMLTNHIFQSRKLKQ